MTETEEVQNVTFSISGIEANALEAVADDISVLIGIALAIALDCRRQS